jgi:hypothetical protein
MITFAADRGALIAFSTKDGPAPYESKIQRADPATKAWRTVYTSDSHFITGQVVAGRAAVIEYREPFQGGGAYSVDVTVVDLSTGTVTKVDGFAMSKATYRGGGGAPRRPNGGIRLGPDRVAWTRLIEGPGGSVTGELRVAPLADPTKVTLIGSSAEWIAAVGVDAHRLVYVTGGKTEDQLHVRDLDTGTDRVVKTGPVGDQQRENGIPGFNRAAVNGDWAIWTDRLAPGAQQLHALNLASGAERTIDARGPTCGEATVGTRYVTWYCSGNAFGVLDAATLEPIPAPVGFGLAPTASDDALIWFAVIPGGRTVTLFRPR